MQFLQTAAQSGDAVAQYHLGLEMILGRRLPRDYTGALQWLQAATDNGSDASLTIGVMYENGWGVEKNYVEALRLFRQAAAGGESTALCKIGYYLEAGAGVEKDVTAGRDYLARAAAAGAICMREGMAPDVQ
jgi:TPR repeat protein